jgi:hypothetical protein
MRVVEHGFRAIAKILKVTIPKMELEFADWEKVIEAIRIEIPKVKSRSPGRSAKKTRELDFYQSSLDEIIRFKTMRNDVMHTRGNYNEGEAKGAYSRVSDFMQRMANAMPNPR